MSGEKNPKLAGLEHSLIQFLTSKKEVDEKVAGGHRRVRGLSIGLDLRNPKKPLITVQIGMCEAAFNVKNGLKERGNCFNLERFVRDWFERPTVSAAIEKFVQEAKDNM